MHTLPVFVCEICELKFGALDYAMCSKCGIPMIRSEDEEMVIERPGKPGIVRKKQNGSSKR